MMEAPLLLRSYVRTNVFFFCSRQCINVSCGDSVACEEEVKIQTYQNETVFDFHIWCDIFMDYYHFTSKRTRRFDCHSHTSFW